MLSGDHLTLSGSMRELSSLGPGCIAVRQDEEEEQAAHARLTACNVGLSDSVNQYTMIDDVSSFALVSLEAPAEDR